MAGHDIWHLQFVFDGLLIHLISCHSLSVSQLLLVNFFAYFEGSYHMAYFFNIAARGSVVDLVSKIIKEDVFTIDMEVAEKPKTIDVYVQAWHNQTWMHKFMGIFKG